jgi:hypothetical protein
MGQRSQKAAHAFEEPTYTLKEAIYGVEKAIYTVEEPTAHVSGEIDLVEE